MEHSNDTTNEQKNRFAELERKLARLEKRLTAMEQERDAARRALVNVEKARLLREGRLVLCRGELLTSVGAFAVKRRILSMADAIAQRNERYPFLSDAVGLAESYALAVQL